KYAVELGTYKISFLPRNAIKGQVLADFLSDAPDGEAEEECFRMPEIPPEVDDTEVWTLFTDGAASLKGSGAGLVLIGPSGLEYMERIFKKKTKNEAKMTKPDSEWKSRKKQSQNPSPSLKKSTQVNPEAKSQEK
ncbi:hypothetical protein Tco_0296883, partial [Tanacetum coccineum]